MRTNDAAFVVNASGDQWGVQVERGLVESSGVDGVTSVAAGQRLSVLPDGKAWVSPISGEFLLDVDWPEAVRTNDVHAVLSGVADPGSLIVVSGVRKPTQVRVGRDGRFEVGVDLIEGRHSVGVSAQSVMGTRKAENWTVELDTKGPIIRGEAAVVP